MLWTQLHLFWPVLFLFNHYVWLFASPWTAAHQASLSFTVSQILLKFMSIELAMHLILCLFSFCLQSFPASESLPRSWLLASGGQNIGASASILPINIQGWFPLELTGLISLQSSGHKTLNGHSFPAPQFKSISSSVLTFLYGPTLTSIHDYWKNYSFD